LLKTNNSSSSTINKHFYCRNRKARTAFFKIPKKWPNDQDSEA